MSGRIRSRRICWPNPDATCLEGGCGYCNSRPFRELSTIRRYAQQAGVLPNRGQGSKGAMQAYQDGLAHNFFNAECRS